MSQALRWAAGLAVVYVVLIFMLPTNQGIVQHYHLTAFEYRMMLLALNLPTIIAWLAAFIGYAKLREYVQSIRETPEGDHLDKMATGTAWLAWSLPVAALVALILGGLANKWASLYPATVVISNYTKLIFPLVAFSIIGAASHGLMRLAKVRFGFVSSRVVALLFLGGGVMYSLMTFKHMNPASLGSTQNPYFLPVWLVVLTIIIPYLYTWFVGLLAAYEITLFSRQTRGVLYKQALRILVLGLVIVIASFVALQYIKGIQPRVNHSTFDYRMVLSAIFHLIGGGGFVLLAIGAGRLKKIEEV